MTCRIYIPFLPTAAVANAQSSFGSSSFDTGSSTADLPTTTRLEKGFERLGEAYGQKLNQTEEDKTTELLQQALNNELPIIEGQYEEFNFIDSSVTWSKYSPRNKQTTFCHSFPQQYAMLRKPLKTTCPTSVFP
ncbi:hypothetical protein C627_01940 [Corynebacterium glutamicum ZL-6]|uniref:hypothetical protein n=1 Tax=Corynebacterium TaxID=1716 RepID=UPI000807A1E1|nr:MULTISPECIES: hypothetical protein [Corynebacterium]ANR61381.1 hypothetical protein C628_01935 [[Brevibacterium] flavum ZL-1]ANR64380.1 hypothetical protein C627_01940 [Corynebacterium glutamicum ZL-6]PST77039.1 hypothetical protein I919_01965 [Corynebacterium glutamicum ZL-2]